MGTRDICKGQQKVQLQQGPWPLKSRAGKLSARDKKHQEQSCGDAELRTPMLGEDPHGAGDTTGQELPEPLGRL